MSLPSDAEVLKLATQDYYGWCRRHGVIADEPSQDASSVGPIGPDGSQMVWLANSQRLLAFYRAYGRQCTRVSMPPDAATVRFLLCAVLDRFGKLRLPTDDKRSLRE